MEARLVVDQMSTRAEVKAAIDAWITSVEDRDISMLPQVVVQDPDAVWIGPGAGEWLPGYESLEQAMQAQNDALHDIHITVSDETIHLSPSGDMAWATNQWIFGAIMGDQALAMPLRCTWIVEKRQNRWIIVHFHKSSGMP